MNSHLPAKQKTPKPILRFRVFLRGMVIVAVVIACYKNFTITFKTMGGIFESSQQTTGRVSSKIDLVKDKLLQQKSKYYVYESSNLTLPHIRAKARDPSAKPTWGIQGWTKRFQAYAIGELNSFERLEQYRHSDLRTWNISEADFIIVPIPLGATIFWGRPADIQGAFHHLFHNEPYFKRHPEKHVYMTTNERLLRSDDESLNHFAKCCGVSREIIARISPGLLVRDTDHSQYYEWSLRHPNSDWNIYQSTFRHMWSIGYIHESSNEKYNLTIPSWKKKHYVFFYRGEDRRFLCNSTMYRAALQRNTSNSNNNTSTMIQEKDLLVQPSAVGWNVEPKQWLHKTSNAKYCVVVRGDNPASRSMWVGIRLGCIPIIVSNALPSYLPIYRSLFKYDDFGVVLDERSFLRDPSGTLNNGIKSLSESDIKKKLDGMAALQHLIALDHPDSLFVPAFVHETVVRMGDNRSHVPEWVEDILKNGGEMMK